MSSFLAKVDLAATTACAQHFAWDLKTQPLVFSRCVHLPFSFLSESNQKAAKQKQKKHDFRVQKPSGFSLLLCKITLSTGKLTKLP